MWSFWCVHQPSKDGKGSWHVCKKRSVEECLVWKKTGIFLDWSRKELATLVLSWNYHNLHSDIQAFRVCTFTYPIHTLKTVFRDSSAKKYWHKQRHASNIPIQTYFSVYGLLLRWAVCNVIWLCEEQTFFKQRNSKKTTLECLDIKYVILCSADTISKVK